MNQGGTAILQIRELASALVKRMLANIQKLPTQYPNDVPGVGEYLYNLDNEIRNFSESLQEQLKRGQVDIYSPQPPV
jgi:hypothetical protein